MEFAPHTDDDVREMLTVVGVTDIDELFAVIPAALAAPAELGLPAGLAEADVVRRLRRLAGRNRSVDDAVCFLGGGAYDHYVPAIVASVTGRGEFATSYTPYQAEISQGNLQALFEFQTLVSEVLGLPVANSSLYDGASAVLEAVLLCVGATGRERVVVAETLDPRYRDLLATYAPGLGLEIETLAPAASGSLAPDRVAPLLTGAAALVVGHPNAVGVLEDIPALAAVVHQAGSRLAVAFDPLLAGVLEPPGRLGADVVTGDGLSAGNQLSFGGPGCGLLACRTEDVRRLPGRLVGQTVDAADRRGFVLTLQAREQHIRREKATSNICTNQALNALATAVYLSWLGPQGLRELGEACLAGRAYARREFERAGVELAYAAPSGGKELALVVDQPAQLAQRLAAEGLLVGPVIEVAGRELLLVAVTEQRTKNEIDALVSALVRLGAEPTPATALSAGAR